MKLQKFKIKLCYIFFTGVVLAGCNSGGTATSSSQIAQPVSVPLFVYSGGGQTKYYAYTSAGGGTPGQTVIDTGSDIYYVNQSSVGPNVTYTNESVTLYYDFGHRQVNGILAYAPVSMYSGSNVVITSAVNTPIVVVPDAPPPFIGLMGVGMRSNISVNLYFAYPYNQALSVNLPESAISFGLFDHITSGNGFSWVQLESQACKNYATPLESSANCWNTFGLPISANFNQGESTITAPLMNGLLDTGSDSGFQLDPMPGYVQISNGYTTNFAYATLQTSTGPLLMYMTPYVYAAQSNYNGGNFVNIGNNVFNYYQVIYDRYDGKVWFKSAQ